MSSRPPARSLKPARKQKNEAGPWVLARVRTAGRAWRRVGGFRSAWLAGSPAAKWHSRYLGDGCVLSPCPCCCHAGAIVVWPCNPRAVDLFSRRGPHLLWLAVRPGNYQCARARCDNPHRRRSHDRRLGMAARAASGGSCGRVVSPRRPGNACPGRVVSPRRPGNSGGFSADPLIQLRRPPNRL